MSKTTIQAKNMQPLLGSKKRRARLSKGSWDCMEYNKKEPLSPLKHLSSEPTALRTFRRTVEARIYKFLV